MTSLSVGPGVATARQSLVTAPPVLSDRVRAPHEEVRSARPAVSAERALLVTRYFRWRSNRAKPMVRQKAEALATVLAQKAVHIRPRELLVGCFTPYRVGASCTRSCTGSPCSRISCASSAAG